MAEENKNSLVKALVCIILGIVLILLGTVGHVGQIQLLLAPAGVIFFFIGVWLLLR